MGYNTRYKIDAAIPKEVPLKDTRIVADIVGFFTVRGKDVDECNIAALITQFPQHFNVGQGPTLETLENRLEEISGYSFEFGFYSDECKWYDWLKDMIKLSLEFPEVTFRVHGEGEENDDIWRATVKNGEWKLKKARVVFDDEE